MACHADLFSDAADLDDGVRSGDAVDANGDARLGVRLEPGGGHRQVVITLRQVWNRIVASVVRRGLTGQAGGRVRHGHRCLGHDGARLIRQRSDERTVQDLR